MVVDRDHVVNLWRKIRSNFDDAGRVLDLRFIYPVSREIIREVIRKRYRGIRTGREYFLPIFRTIVSVLYLFVKQELAKPAGRRSQLLMSFLRREDVAEHLEKISIPGNARVRLERKTIEVTAVIMLNRFDEEFRKFNLLRPVPVIYKDQRNFIKTFVLNTDEYRRLQREFSGREVPEDDVFLQEAFLPSPR